MNYAVQVTPLPDAEGGGFQAIVPQFGRGVVGYGQNEQEAVADLLEVLPSFLGALADTGQSVPKAEREARHESLRRQAQAG